MKASLRRCFSYSLWKGSGARADADSIAAEVGRALQEATSFEGSPQEKQAKVYLASLGIDYDALTKEEFITLIGILKKSKKLKIRQGSQRGKGKRKK